ncbi:hypothetical protein [Faecalibacter sp. LW9]|uniref:hypothetical protein n=1 Tax=Faecalibacter sp. LW9 TaxID=3103144 RepID=UPI002AFE7F68|nr:hypothetical protein [Faecalibacter sp. LW9]
MPEEKVVKRYHATLNNLFPALKLIDKAYIFDNSTQEMRLFAQVKKSELEIMNDKVSNWFIKLL